MKIDNHPDVTPANSGRTRGNTPKPEPVGTGESGNSRAKAHGDRLDLTGISQRLQALEQQLAAEPMVNKQRVEAVRQALAAGTLQVDPERIAERLIDIEKALNSSR